LSRVGGGLCVMSQRGHISHGLPFKGVRRLCLADFGHAMSPWHCCWPKHLEDSSHSQAKSRLFALLYHFTSSIWVQWVVLQCSEDCILICWLLLSVSEILTHQLGLGNYIQKSPHDTIVLCKLCENLTWHIEAKATPLTFLPHQLGHIHKSQHDTAVLCTLCENLAWHI
jgi:hypothetical protein